MSNAVSLGRHTVAGMIGAAGRQSQDWSAAYRLFERGRFDTMELFDVPLKELLSRSEPDAPAVGMIDDTLLRKSGRHVHGAAWKRDPLGPKFSDNFVWAQRWLQISLALPEANGRCRALPVDFIHCPTPAKPGKEAGTEALLEYNALRNSMRLPKRAAERIEELRRRIPAGRKLVIAGDGGYTNGTVFRGVPDGVSLLGRLRKDAKLFSVPQSDASSQRGRKRVYGALLPTPEQMRQDDALPWREVRAATGDKLHTFRIKSVQCVRSKIAGERDLKLVIVQPLRYRLTAKSRLLYRSPAYIISTDPSLSDEDILQWYLWRWEIELNFRDEKSVLGIQQPQVRTRSSVESLPPFVACSYSLLLLAGRNALGNDKSALPLPKWRNRKTVSRISTNHYLSAVRSEMLDSFNANFRRFPSTAGENAKPLYFIPPLDKLVLTARK